MGLVDELKQVVNKVVQGEIWVTAVLCLAVRGLLLQNGDDELQ